MNTYPSEGSPSSRRRRLLRTALGGAAVAALLTLGTGCVVAVRPAPVATVYAEPGEVIVNAAPPAPIYETVAVAPGPGYFWIGGYYHWSGGRWVWYRGHYERPPHPGARWIAPRYVVRGNARVYIRGYWH
jgi:hypothetical protein